MIAHIFGRVVEKFGSSVIVDVGGVGYEIQIPLSDYGAIELNDEVKFYTYHYIREQNEELFGFSKLATKKLFELLITVQGVGPKAGLAILSISDGERVRGAIANSDVAFVSKASGVGKRTAERIVVDLSDKVGRPNLADSGVNLRRGGSDEALEALMALGYDLQTASEALVDIPNDLTTSQRVELALKGKK